MDLMKPRVLVDKVEVEDGAPVGPTKGTIWNTCRYFY